MHTQSLMINQANNKINYSVPTTNIDLILNTKSSGKQLKHLSEMASYTIKIKFLLRVIIYLQAFLIIALHAA